jgi:uncharacterized paraquat-inducible protein A
MRVHLILALFAVLLALAVSSQASANELGERSTSGQQTWRNAQICCRNCHYDKPDNCW